MYIYSRENVVRTSIFKRRNHVYASLSTHPGFVSSLCYGDITIGAKFTSLSTPTPNVSSNESTPVSLSPTKSLTAPMLIPDLDPELILSVHDFDKVILNKPTKCGFCLKKVGAHQNERILNFHSSVFKNKFQVKNILTSNLVIFLR